ncbi:hypothetical protein NC652_016478 [Populus alba x Populus x berolinensis]|nr:hypothetical protein NC652_016478 [Populus alba x Populus x berolinensis]
MIPFPLDMDGSSRTREALGPFSDHASITFYSGPNTLFCRFHSFLLFVGVHYPHRCMLLVRGKQLMWLESLVHSYTTGAACAGFTLFS